MNAFLSALGGKLAERWLSLLVLPGLLLLGACVAGGGVLGHRHWNDVGRLRARVDALAAEPAADDPGTILLVVSAVLLTAAALGLAAQALGSVLEAWWTGDPADPAARRLAARRRERWRVREDALAAAERLKGEFRLGLQPEGAVEPSEEDVARLRRERDRIAPMAPRRATRGGDLMLAAAERVRRRYGLSLATAWPRLWLILPDPARSQVQAAQGAFGAAARLGGWGAGYALLGLWWWPGLLVAAAVWFTAWRRGRAAVETLAVLVEASVDLYGHELAARLRVDLPGGPLGRGTGEQVSRLLGKPDL
ncbi:hypothetical protein ACIBF1_43920 [Spirillospora sp. NPDC050679]